MPETALRKSPLVSVVMPSFNQAKFIEASIRSVLDQSHRELELIVMDGGSTDGTLAILERMARADPRLRWASAPDDGPADAINKAMAKARGSMVGWLNSDDLYTQDAMQRAVQMLQSDSNPLMVYGHAAHIDDKGEHLSDYPTLKPEVGWARLADGCYVCQPTVFLKKVAVTLLGPLDPSLKTAFDFDWWLRAFLWFEGRIGFVDRVQAFSRLHEACITRKERVQVAAEGVWLIRKHMGWLDTRWIVTYMNEALQQGQAHSIEQLWSALYPHLASRLAPTDMEILRNVKPSSRVAQLSGGLADLAPVFHTP